MLRMLWSFIVRSQDRTPMLLTHFGSSPVRWTLCLGPSRWLRRGIGDGGGLALTPTASVAARRGHVAWTDTPLTLPREDPECVGYLDRVRGDASSWMSVLPTKLINLILDAATLWLSWLSSLRVSGPRETTKDEPMSDQ